MKTILAKARIGLVRTTQEIRQEFVSIDPGSGAGRTIDYGKGFGAKAPSSFYSSN